MAEQPESNNNGLYSRVRSASISVMNANPQLGMWQASGLVLARAPTFSELRDPESGGDNIEFNAQGHSIRKAVQEEDGELSLVKSTTRVMEKPMVTIQESTGTEVHVHRSLHDRAHDMRDKSRALRDKHKVVVKAKWGPTIVNGLKAFWRFFKTPSGFIITIYFLNIVAWGAMLFFLLLKAAPAMNHPSANDNSSPRKIWLEIDSQVLNALFCVTGFGLAPWRFRDLYYFIRARHLHNRHAMFKLYQQNKSWFRPPAWATTEGAKVADTTIVEDGKELIDMPVTFTGDRAPPTPFWKLAFVIGMMVLNTLLQAVLCFFMWHYNRINRPTWATGTFIALGCGVAMMAGLMSFWEGSRVKKIEGPEVEVVTEPVVEKAEV